MKKIVNISYLATSAIGALLIALNVNANVLGYVLFLISSILASVIVLKSNADRSLLYVNVMFGIINVIGIIRYWI